MLYTLATILVVLWLLGMTTHFLGSFIHILLVLALVSIVVRLIQGRPAV